MVCFPGRLRKGVTWANGGSTEEPEKEKLGPLDQYQQWVSQGKLRDDEYQRGMLAPIPALALQMRISKEL